MEEHRHTEEENGIRADCLKESQKRGVWVDESGQENPHVGTGSCRPATKGKLAEPIKRAAATDFINSISTQISLKFIDAFQKLEKKYGKIIALQFIDDELAEIIKVEFEIELDLKIQQIHEWFGEPKPTEEEIICDNCGAKVIRIGTCIKCLNCGNSIGCS